ncbi:polysaccharide pyruvyl transferase CsaB [Oceanobacillus damuensis]|uniref:polysaccharide pyruvyl transferase CsaB n=1 Tax=Oceanobacillus damuensis TaxID=937928 RepID=UPI0008323051|nr:polysaccharide pyruvyl transferase CsaB [Oceanobacillus damuensis]
MHIVLSGYYGFDNVGDEAILFSIIQAIRNTREDVKITVLSNNPEATRQTYGVEAVNRWKLKEISDVLKFSDGLISGGGSLLQDETGWKSIPYYTGVMQIAKRHNTPVFIYAQGMGPINKWFSKWLVKLTLNKAADITVRDTDSQELLQKIGVRKTISIVPDPVMALDGTSFTSNWLEEQALGDFVAVSVRDWPTEQPYKQRIAECLDKVVRAGNKVVFVPMHGEHDAATSREVAGMMMENSTVSPADASIEEKIAIIGESRLLLGMRLHSLIFSAVTHTPFVALSYDPKIDSFAAICEQPVSGHVENDNWDGLKLYEQVSDSLANEIIQQEMLQKKAEEYRKQALETAVMAFEAFK